MKKNFDFDSVGKRMPYTVPEGFFDRLEEDILQEVQPAAVPAAPKAGHRKLRLWLQSAAAAAAIALVWLGGARLLHPSAERLPDVEQVFADLSTDDQDYMLSVFQDDVFMNEP